MFKNLDKLPGSAQLHRWADWVEILALANPDHYYSLDDLADATEFKIDSIESETKDDEDPLEQSTDPLVDDLATSEGGSSAAKDAITRRANDVFRLLRNRSRRFANSYPFEIDSTGKSVLLREPSEARKVYLFLLLCSTFRYVESKKIENALSSTFEFLSRDALAAKLPAGAIVRVFGKNPSGDADYSGHLFDKIKTLAGDLGERLIATRDDFDDRNSGDSGLDVVAWIPFKDDLVSKFMFLGQSACTADWTNKQHSSSVNNWSPLIHFTVHPTNVVFIPFDYRNASGKWHQKHVIANTIVMDRERLVDSLRSTSDGGAYAVSEVVDSKIDEHLGFLKQPTSASK